MLLQVVKIFRPLGVFGLSIFAIVLGRCKAVPELFAFGCDEEGRCAWEATVFALIVVEKAHVDTVQKVVVMP